MPCKLFRHAWVRLLAGKVCLRVEVCHFDTNYGLNGPRFFSGSCTENWKGVVQMGLKYPGSLGDDVCALVDFTSYSRNRTRGAQGGLTANRFLERPVALFILHRL